MKISIFLSNNEIFATIVKIIILLLIKSERFFIKLFGRSPGKDIAVISFHKLGDSVFTIPAIKEIRNHYNKDIYIFCYKESKPIFELFFNGQFIIDFKFNDFYFNGRIAKKSIKRKLSEVNPEKIFDLTGSIISTSLLYNSNAIEIIGINETYYKPIYSTFVPLRIKPHVMDIYIDAIKPDIPVLDKNLKEFPVEVRREGYILIHPFAGWKAKEWNFNKYILLSKMLNTRYNIKFISHPGGINDLIQQELTAQGIDIVICLDVYELIKIINSGILIISNDSGPIYIASMLGKPTFTIYGPTNPEFSFPFGRYHKFTIKKIKCSPEKDKQYCFTNAGRLGCPSFECMNDFMVKDVYKEIESFLDELKIKQKSQVT